MAVNPNETAYQQKPTTDPATMTAAKTAWSNAQRSGALPRTDPNSLGAKAQQAVIAKGMSNASAQAPAQQAPAQQSTPILQPQTTSQAVGSMVTDLANQVQQRAAQQPSVQTQVNAQTTQEATGGIYKVGSNGQAPKGLKAGDQVVTSGGTYTITAVNPDGTYQSKLTNANQKLENYTGAYANAPVAPSNVYRVVPGTNNAPKGLKVGDQVVTSGGTYQITGVNADGSYQSQLVNRNQTIENYTGSYATAPGTAPAAPSVPSYAQTYNPNIDYTAAIEAAKAAGDYRAAAALEQIRNQKIDAEGTSDKYAKTNTFQQFYDQVTPEDLFRYQNGYVADNRIRTQNPYPGMETILDQLTQNERDQAANRINYATEQAVREQNRIYEDALPEFQKQRNQVDIDAARAMSNSALYAEARGDRGGIGQSQYNEIQAAAMQNRQAINTAQQKLATDIARKVADLRAQGEYQLSDAMLELGNQYLSRLMDLKAQGAEFALNIEQMNRELANQDRQFQLQVANITGEYNGQPTYAAQKYEQERYAAWVEAMAKAGMEVSPELLKAAGLDGISGDISKYANLMAALSFSSGGSGGGGGSGRGSGGGGGGDGGSGLPEDPGNGGNGNENKPTLQNYMNNIAGRVSAIDRNSSLSYSQKTAKKKALVDQLYTWVDQDKISMADAGHIIEAYDLTGSKAAAKEANTQNKRKVDKEGRGLE